MDRWVLNHLNVGRQAGIAITFAIGLFLSGCGTPERPVLESTQTATQESDMRTRAQKETQADQTASPATPPEGDTAIDAGSSILKVPYSVALWNVDCEQSQAGAPAAVSESPGFFRFSSTGDHNVSREKLVHTSLQVEGKWCDPNKKRTIVFAVDVSSDNDYRCGILDPRRCGPDVASNNTCGRAELVKAASSWAVARGYKVGFLTWSSGVVTRSNGLTFKASDMTQNQLRQTFCGNDNDADWTVPLAQSEALFAAAKADETKEIVLIGASDITAARLQAATTASASLKQKGFNLSVVLMNGSAGGATTASTFASPKSSGSPFFLRAPDGTGLTSVLPMLEQTGLAARQLRVRAIGDADWKVVDIKTEDQNMNFHLDTGIELEQGAAVTGYEVELTEADWRGRVITLGSRLILKE